MNNNQKSKSSTEKWKLIIFPLAIVIIVLIICFACDNGSSELKQPTTLDADCFEMASNEIEYAEKFLYNDMTANDAYTSINIICDDDTLSEYHSDPEYDVYEKISDLKLAIKNAMYAEERNKNTEITRDVVLNSVKDLKNTINSVE
jgi:hypothetical protein